MVARSLRIALRAEFLVFFGVIWPPGVAWAAPLRPDSPEVRQAVDRGIAYLAKTDDSQARVGGRALIGLAMLKSGVEPSHPQVRKMRDEVLKAVASGWTKEPDPVGIYSHGAAILFLVELDPSAHRETITTLCESLAEWQKPHGGWGYPHDPLGDTSMTQYAILGLWTAAQVGVNVDSAVWEKAVNWLIRTQDLNGRFSYHPEDPGSFQRRQQAENVNGHHALTTGGTASLYLARDFLHLQRRRKSEGLPQAMKLVEQAVVKNTNRVDVGLLQKAISDGDSWVEQNFQVEAGTFQHYYLYALERYYTLRSAFRGGTDNLSWYDDCARWLLKTQKPDGSWPTISQTGDTVDTAFSILFLVRSMKKTVEKVELLGRGLLVGGRGLPSGSDDVRLRLGSVVPRPLEGPADELFSALEESSGLDYLRAVEGLEEMAERDAEGLKTNVARLRQLAKGEGPEARRVAVRTLGRSGDLDNVPILIHALTDPDPAIAELAEESLRRLTRKFDGVSGGTDRAQVVEQWKAWYRKLRPDARFEE